MDQSSSGSPIVFIGVVIAVILAVRWALRAIRHASLMKKYGDAALVARLMRKEIWESQTSEQLIDSIGRPAAIDNKVFKTKTSNTWKYKPIGKKQYALRVFVENNVVVGWKRNAS